MAPYGIGTINRYSLDNRCFLSDCNSRLFFEILNYHTFAGVQRLLTRCPAIDSASDD